MPPAIAVDRDKIGLFCRRHEIRSLALFGSVLRDDFGRKSDVDVLVDFQPGSVPGFLRLYALEEELSVLFGGRRVDSNTQGSPSAGRAL